MSCLIPLPTHTVWFVPENIVFPIEMVANERAFEGWDIVYHTIMLVL